MHEILHRFAHPLVFTLMGLFPLLAVAAFLAARRRRRTLAKFGSPLVLRPLLARGRRTRTLRTTCLVSGFSLLITACAGPRWGYDWEQPAAPGRDVIAVLDMSRSMLARDVLPNRFERAKKALEDLSYTVQQRGGHRLGLVAFAGRARIVCPLTHDYDHFRFVLAQLDAAYPGSELGPKDDDHPSGTRIGAGLSASVEAQDPRLRGYQDILLISDGDDPARDSEWREGIRAANEHKIPIHTVGVGDSQTASPIPLKGDEPLQHNKKVVLTRLTEEPLREIARLTGGTYTPAGLSALPLGQLFHDRIEGAAVREDQEDALPQERLHSAWFFGSALAFLGLEIVLGGIRPRAKTLPAGLEDVS